MIYNHEKKIFYMKLNIKRLGLDRIAIFYYLAGPDSNILLSGWAGYPAKDIY